MSAPPVEWQVIHLHALAPPKPNEGTPCNGCGVCCASAPCPVSLTLLRHRRQVCPALEWHESLKHYRCGMVIRPSFYVSWLPRKMDTLVARLMKRWIAADQSCDFAAEVDPNSSAHP